MKHFLRLIPILLLAVFLTSCGSKQPVEEALLETRKIYRSANIAIRAACTDSDQTSSTVKVHSVLKGEVQPYDVFTINQPLKEGTDYLLYLSKDGETINVLFSSPIKNDAVTINGTKIPYQDLMEDINSILAVVDAPDETIQYTNIDDLYSHTDALFLAKVISVEDALAKLRTTKSGVSMIEPVTVRFVKVSILIPVKGNYHKSDTATIAYVNLENNDIAPVYWDDVDVLGSDHPLTVGDTCLFFLHYGDDESKTHLYPINAAQAYIRLPSDVVESLNDEDPSFQKNFTDVVREGIGLLLASEES